MKLSSRTLIKSNVAFSLNERLPIHCTLPTSKDLSWSKKELKIRRFEIRLLRGERPIKCRFDIYIYADGQERPYTYQVQTSLVRSKMTLNNISLFMPSKPTWLTTKVVASCQGKAPNLLRSFETQFPGKHITFPRCQKNEITQSPFWFEGQCLALRHISLTELSTAFKPYCKTAPKNLKACETSSRR